VEKVGKEVVASTELRISGMGVDHGREQTSPQCGVFVLLLTGKVACVLEEPTLGVDFDLFVVAINAERVRAVAKEIRKYELGGSRR
jgi:hypothetical protein